MTQPSLRPPTMADVARRAGVSHQTVSRVLGDHPNVRDGTRAKVLNAIGELGYRPNSSARALVTRRTRTLGVVASNTTLYGPGSTLFALEEAALAKGYLVSTVSLRKLTVQTLSEALDRLIEGGVDGLLTIVPQLSATAALTELPHPFPVVTVGSGIAAEIPCVTVDQHRGAHMATGHLLAAGHRTVWHVAGPEDWQDAQGRTAGWRATLEAAGIEPPEPLTGDWSPRSGYLAGQELVGRAGRELTAVFVANDQMALGVLRALREAGLRTPQDVAVVGFDDIPESEFFAPPLTTIRQDFTEVGRRSIALLLDQVEGRDSSGTPRIVIEPQLIVRTSSSPPSP
ncbi:LacI family DNA-binding transcriptional regulator [Streptomyces sp. PSKA54]|uniref:LacI family DNA-binding transcriptional regulator n=1 Tax=Streptomyces himalayensis subsp. aureolus TaxID=2758039 RepID=A0A7W2D1U7_9ACTN|nr:LacI family DNA-binding transcriptional regulator [Streptomyces himalayensis]MBA4863232.1 LacI family DNA-binding transcriptional regulator [Streptomyces himalayensis subsp. aureolus]